MQRIYLFFFMITIHRGSFSVCIGWLSITRSSSFHREIIIMGRVIDIFLRTEYRFFQQKIYVIHIAVFLYTGTF